MERSRKKRIVLQLSGMVVLAGLDQLLKYIVLRFLAPVGNVVAIPRFLAWTYAENTGAAFSLFTGGTSLLSVFTGVAIAGGIVYLCVSKKHPIVFDICVPLILAGGLGNLIDRLYRGFVVDFIRVLFIDFPIFNFADCLVTCSAIAMIIFLIYDIIRDARKNKVTAAPADEEHE